jgi:uncharacterized repeat protein (TIGR02543 family)
MILADNGSSWFISGAPDERWNNDILSQLKRVTGANFEAVDVSSLMVSPDSAQVKTSGAPLAPSNLNSVLNGVDISLTWTDNSSNEAFFVLERRIDSGAFSAVSQVIPANATNFLNAGLPAGHTYTYRVKARNSSGDSGYSNETSKYIAAASFNLSISSSAGGSVTLPGEGVFTYSNGAVVNLAASPDSGYEFVIWTGDVANFTSPATTVTVNADKSVYANFALKKNIYVADIAMTVVSSSSGKSARAVVSVRDNQGKPVAGARVRGAWSGLVAGSLAGTTAADGKAIFNSNKTKKKGTITFTVTGLSAAGYAYDPARNVETRDSVTIR